MRSVIAEAHFDGSRNVIALFGGMRRYILTHPDQVIIGISVVRLVLELLGRNVGKIYHIY